MELKILVIDDNPQIRQELISHFEQIGDAVKVAQSEKEALAALALNKFNLIISELLLPELNGLSFFQRLKHNPDFAVIPFIFFSDLPLEINLFRFCEFDFCLHKSNNLSDSNQDLFNLVEKIRSEYPADLKSTNSPVKNPAVFDSDQALTEFCLQLRTAKSTLLNELAAREKRYDFVTNSTQIGYWEWYPEENQIFFEPDLIIFLGHSFSVKNEDQDLWKWLIHPDDFDMFYENLNRLAHSEISEMEKEIRLLHKNGNIIWFNFYAKLTNNAERQPVKIEGTYREISREKEIYQGIMASRKFENMGRLASGIAHDFNNLLTTILGNLELLTVETPIDDSRLDEISEIQKAAQRAVWLTRQLQLYTRKQTLQPTILNLNQVSEDIYAILRRIIGENIHLTLKLEGQIKPVKIDKGQVEQLVMNLVINLTHLFSGKGQFVLETRNQIIKEVSTHSPTEEFAGVLITASEIILAKQFTVDKISEDEIPGLTFIKQIIHQNKGRFVTEISNTHELTLGAYFPVTNQIEKIPEKKIIPLSALHGNGEKILFVEDEKDIRDFAFKSLQEYDYKIVLAEDAKSAFKLFENEKGNFDLILCDVILPDRSGPDLVRELLKSRPDTNILFTSGYTGTKAQGMSIQKDGFRFLPKPYTLPELLKAIKEVIGKE